MKSDWRTEALESCIEKITYTKKILRKDFLDEGDFPIVSQEQEFINGYWNNVKDVYKVGKPVVVFGDHTQVIKYIDFDFVLGADGVKILSPKREIHTKYLYYYLKSIELKKLGYSRHFRLLKDIQIAFPPFTEQQRIIAILDQAFAAIATAKKNAEKNLQNTRELFETFIENTFSEIKKVGNEEQLGDICDNLDSRRVPITKKDRTSGKYPYYGASGIVDYVDKYIFDEDLLLVSEDGANLLARTYPIAFSISGKVWVNNHAHVLRFKNKDTQKYIEFYLNSIMLNDYVSGMAQPKLNQKMLNSIRVPFPDIDIQKQVVEKFEILFNKAKYLEKNYHQELNYLEELKKTILQKAFSGELTEG